MAAHSSASSRSRLRNCTILNLPELDIASITARSKSPKVVQYDDSKSLGFQRKSFYRYLIWAYANTDQIFADIAKDVATSKDAVGDIIRFYNVAPEKRTAGYHARKENKFRSPEFELECKRLFDSGISTYRAIAKELQSNETAVRRVAQRNGWDTSNRMQVDWKASNIFPACSLTNYKRYLRVVRHFTESIYIRHKASIDPKGLRGKNWHVDHLLSVYDAYHRGTNPLPWQMVVHPANLELKTSEANSAKGKHSEIDPDELLSRIQKYENKYDKVFLPVIVEEAASVYEFVYGKGRVDSIKSRITQDSKFKVADLKRLWKYPPDRPIYEAKSHFKRCHYEWMVAKALRSTTNSDIALELGCNVNQVKVAFDRIGLPSAYLAETKSDASIIHGLKRQGLSLRQISKKIQLSKVATIYLYYRFMENF